MIFFALLLTGAILVIALISIIGGVYDRKIQKKVEKFVTDVNSGSLTVYCYQRISGSTLIDSNNQEILVAGKHAKIKSDAYCSEKFITQCYRAVINWWHFDGATIFLYVKPMNNSIDRWRVEKVDNYSIKCSHPIMMDYQVYLDDNSPVFSVGETVILRSKVNKGKNILWHYEYEIVD